MSSLKLVIPFTPKPKKSVGLNSAQRIWYNPQSKEAKKVVAYLKKVFPGPFLRGPLLVVAHHLLPLPVHVRCRMRRESHLRPHIARPDGDNLEKHLNDCFNGIVWEDDSQIVWMLRSKSWSKYKTGATLIYITELDEEAPDYAVILEHISQNLEIPEDYDGAIQAEKG